MGKTYSYFSTVTIGDTNLYQNMYFLNFFKLQGVVRELWVRDCVQNYEQSMKGGIFLITKAANCDFRKDFYLFDSIEVQLQFTSIGKASTDLRFQFFKKGTNDLHAVGIQTIVFADSNHKICPVPENFERAIREFFDPKVEIKNCNEKVSVLSHA